MGQRVKNFGDFVLLKESVNQIEEAFPSKWKVLQDLGFYDATPLRIKANGNILLKNDRFNYYPEGVVLQPNSGYVRNKGVQSGFLRRGLNLDQMIDYLIDRFQKYEGETSPEVSPGLVIIFKLLTKGKAKKNPETGRFDFSGNVEIIPRLFDEIKEVGAKFGVVEGGFTFRSETQYQITKEDLEFFPTSVKKKFAVYGLEFIGFSDLRFFPELGTSIDLRNVIGLKSMEGIKINGGSNSEISIRECSDLESLGTGLPDTVREFKLYLNGRPKLTTMSGCPKRVIQDFTFRGTGITSLLGGPEQVGRDYDVRGNSRLTSLENFPLDFPGILKSDIITCQFNLADRIEIIETGNAHDIGWGGYSKFQADPSQREFVATSLSPGEMQKLVDKNPEKMAVTLKGVLNLPPFKNIKWPENLKVEVDLLSDLSDVGL